MILRQGILAERSLQVGLLSQEVLYECPANRYVKGKLFYKGIVTGGTGVNTPTLLFSNAALGTGIGIGILSGQATTIGNKFYSVGAADCISAAASASDPNGQTATTTNAPSGVTYFFAPGDQIRTDITGAGQYDINFMIVGTESDEIIKTPKLIETVPGTYTMYTCPTGKTALGKFLFRIDTFGDTVDFIINGIIVASFSGDRFISTQQNNRFGVQAAFFQGTTPDGSVSPTGVTYRLDEGDIVQMRLFTTPLVQAMFIAQEYDKYG